MIFFAVLFFIPKSILIKLLLSSSVFVYVYVNQAKSLFLQSQTELFGSTISTSKKSETCFGRWQTTHQQHVFEPLHIQVSFEFKKKCKYFLSKCHMQQLRFHTCRKRISKSVIMLRFVLFEMLLFFDIDFHFVPMCAHFCFAGSANYYGQ